MAESESIVSFSGLGHSYVPGQWIFRHCHATLPKGHTLALLGPNGSGKTTLLRIILGLQEPTEGACHVTGPMAFVPQLFEASFDYTAIDMVLMGRARLIGLFRQPSRQDEAAALAALDRFGVADLASRSFHSLSGGQRQLVIFARALVADAKVLILDEPASALDLKNQALVLDWIGRLAQEHRLTVVFTTHQPQHALEVADQSLLMMGAERFAYGSTQDVLTEANLESLYGVPLRHVAFDHHGRSIESFVAVLRGS